MCCSVSKRDLQEKPTKETYKKILDLQKKPTKETYNRDQCVAVCLKETYKRDLQKKTITETNV